MEWLHQILKFLKVVFFDTIFKNLFYDCKVLCSFTYGFIREKDSHYVVIMILSDFCALASLLFVFLCLKGLIFFHIHYFPII